MERGIIKKLKEFGLSDKGARIYVALLELELATVSELAKHSGVNRSSTYVVLERLKKKGLAGVSDDKKVRRYVASSPELLLHTAKDKANKHKKIKESIESIVPELNALHKATSHKPVIRMFEGKEAVEYAYNDISLLKTSPDTIDVRVYEDPEGYINLIPDFVELDHKERKRLGLRMYSIYPRTKESGKVIKKYRSLGSKDEFIEIPEDKFKSSDSFTNLTIVGDEVWFDSLKDNYCINIKKKEIANTLRNVFDLAKEEAKRLNKKLK